MTMAKAGEDARNDVLALETKFDKKYRTANQVKDIFDLHAHEYKSKVVSELEGKIVKSVENFAAHVS